MEDNISDASIELLSSFMEVHYLAVGPKATEILSKTFCDHVTYLSGSKALK
jgi:hypothetical protein